MPYPNSKIKWILLTISIHLIHEGMYETFSAGVLLNYMLYIFITEYTRTYPHLHRRAGLLLRNII